MNILRILLRLLAIDHGMYSLNSAIRSSLLLFVGASILWQHKDNRFVSYLLGVLLTEIVDPGGSLGMKLKFTGLSGLTTILGATLAALTFQYEDQRYLVLVLGALLAFVAGLSSGVGPAEFLAGKMGVVSYAVFLGTHPVPLATTVAYTSIGFGASIAFTILSELPGNCDGLRSDLFKTYNSLGHNLLSSEKDLSDLKEDWWAAEQLESSSGGSFHSDSFGAVTATGRIMETQRRIETYGPNDETKKKLLQLVKSADHCRVTFLCLLAPRMEKGKNNANSDHNLLLDFQHAVGRAALRIGELCEFSLIQRIPWFRQRLLRVAVEGVNEAADKAIAVLRESSNGDLVTKDVVDDQIRLIHKIQASIQSAAKTVVDSPWSYHPSIALRNSRPTLCSTSFTSNYGMWVYTMRLTITFTLSLLPYMFLPKTTHSNWFPLTLAFIALAGFGASVSKIALRTIGTILGLALGSALYWANSYRWLITVLLTLVMFGVRIFFFANYGIFTMFITTMVYLLLTRANVPLGTTTLYRFAWTVAAEILYIGSMYIYKPPFEDVIGAKLAAHATAIVEYCREVVVVVGDNCDNTLVDGVPESSKNNAGAVVTTATTSHYDTDFIYAKRKVVMTTRVATDAAIAEACLTPRGKDYFRVEPYALAPAIDLQLLIASSVAATCTEQLETNSKNNSILIEVSDEEALGLLESLAERLVSSANSDLHAVDYSKLMAANKDNRFKAAILRAHVLLGNCTQSPKSEQDLTSQEL